MLGFLVFVVICAGNVHSMALSCTYDGEMYMDGRAIRVGCDDCKCAAGVLECPPEYPSCPRNCTFHGAVHQHGEEWDDVCSACHCNDGTAVCLKQVCADTCEIDGRVYKKGEKFKRDCNDCTCAGNDQLSCTDNKCYCYDKDNKFVDNGESFIDESCNTCWCVNGVSKCTKGNTCFQSCFINGQVIKHGEQLTVMCMVFGCNDGVAFPAIDNCHEQAQEE